MRSLPGSIWFTRPLVKDFSLCRRAFRRLREIREYAGIMVYSPQSYEACLSNFHKLQRLSDSRGRRLFLKEKRELSKS